MVDKCVGESVSLEVMLRYGSCISGKMPTFCLEQAKTAVLCGVDFEVYFCFIAPVNLNARLRKS